MGLLTQVKKGGQWVLCDPEEAQAEANCGYYLRQHHRLIRRHEESISLNPDNTALWQLRIDFELPPHDEAGFKDSDGDERIYLFPLVYLKKNEARIRIDAREEGHSAVPLPIRLECDQISIAALREAINWLSKQVEAPARSFREIDLHKSLTTIVGAKAYVASLARAELRQEVGLDPSKADPDPFFLEVGEKLESSGLMEVLEMLVEHSLVWVTLRGRPSERRSIVLTQEIRASRRPFLRWSFGDLDSHRCTRLDRLRDRLGWSRSRGPTVEIGGRPYGRRDWRVSFSAIAERLGQPLAWIPIEFDLPTIYTKRCRSYHFEVRLPPGRTPRDLRVSNGPALAEPPDHGSQTEIPVQDIRRTLTTRVGRLDLPLKALNEGVQFRVTFGVGDGAFPVLWFIAAAITALMLWIFAGTGASLFGSEPRLDGDYSQTAAAILLIVPALIAALALSSSEVPMSHLIGGARLLLLVTGLSAAVAASALTGAKPFHMEPAWTWTACAIAATAAAVPLATSWLLSNPIVWRRLMMPLNSLARQEAVLAAGIVTALALSGALIWINEGLIARAGIAGLLLTLTIVMNTVATDRAALPIHESRHYIAVSFLLTGFASLILACIELCAVANDHVTGLQEWAERGAWALLLFAAVSGDMMTWITDRAKPRPDEVHVSPAEGRALLAKESVHALPILFERERKLGKRALLDADTTQITR